MNKPNYKIIEATPEWVNRYRELCRQAYIGAYVRPDLGITADMFSEKLFSSPKILAYFEDVMRKKPNHKAWLAVHNNEVFGGIIVDRYPDYCELQAFYVRPDLKGHGIGHTLYARVLEYAKGLPLQVDVLQYVQPTIDMYKHWGFVIDKSKGMVDYDWIEWPEKVRQVYRGIYMIKPAE